MQKVRPASEQRNPVDIIIESVIAVMRRPDLIEAARDFYEAIVPAPAAPVETAPKGLVSGPQLDRALNISASTRNRYRMAGMPRACAAPPRYDLQACRAWLDTRFTPRSERDSADIADIAARNGLRAIGGVR